MSIDKSLMNYRDILEARRANNDAISHMTRQWDPLPSYNVKNTNTTPAQLKSIALNSKRLDMVMEELSVVLKKPKSELKKEAAAMLEEIGFGRKMYVVRWFGTAATKIMCRAISRILVNEKMINNLKANMGLNPVVYVPTHRSYGDFILLSYICYCYDIDLPAVAAGMDFQGMAIVNKLMRDSCTFYMRRSFLTDHLYAAVFKEYLRTLVMHNRSAVEFYIEGTRSRSAKSMAPKYGFMSMLMEPLFNSDVPDITFVPLHITYDKILEERLFAFELLGVPKPKESTSGLIKALNVLDNGYGTILVNVGEPLSAKEHIRSYGKQSVRDNIKPTSNHPQALTSDQNYLVQSLSHEIISKQQELAYVTTFHLIATALSVSLCNKKPFSNNELLDYMVWLSRILKSLGANLVDSGTDYESECPSALATHTNLVKLDRENRLRLLNAEPFEVTEEMKSKMKGHKLSQQTMNTVIPVMMIQLYVNPIMHWVISSAILDLILNKYTCDKDSLFQNYKRLRQLLRYEFPVNELTLTQEFERSLSYLLEAGEVVQVNPGVYSAGHNQRLHELLSFLIWPFITCSYRTTVNLLKESTIEEKQAVRTSQAALERRLTTEKDIHPYCLSLDCILNCIQGLVLVGGLKKERKSDAVLYHVDQGHLSDTSDWLRGLLPNLHMVVDNSNPVMAEPFDLNKTTSKL